MLFGASPIKVISDDHFSESSSLGAPSGSCALVSQFELLSNFIFLEKRDPRPESGKFIASTGLQKGGAYPCGEEGRVAEKEGVGGWQLRPRTGNEG